jgi:hypothetical protein
MSSTVLYTVLYTDDKNVIFIPKNTHYDLEPLMALATTAVTAASCAATTAVAGDITIALLYPAAAMGMPFAGVQTVSARSLFC